MRATERITAGVIDRSSTDEDLRIIEIERGKDPRSKPKGNSRKARNRTMVTLMAMKAQVDRTVILMAMSDAIEVNQKRKAEAKRNEESSRLKALETKLSEQAKRRAQAKRNKLVRMLKTKLLEQARRREESKVATKMWEPGEDPDRKNDGLDT